MRGCADARSRQYRSYIAARDPGDAAITTSAFAISYPVDVSVRPIWCRPAANIRISFEFNCAADVFIFRRPFKPGVSSCQRLCFNYSLFSVPSAFLAANYFWVVALMPTVSGRGIELLGDGDRSSAQGG